MTDFNKPITTVEEAKAFFTGMGCNHFHMMREYPARHKEYYKLHISNETEDEWTLEMFHKAGTLLLENTDEEQFQFRHRNIVTYCTQLKTAEALTKTLELTEFIRDKVPPVDMILVAENINGNRSSRPHRESRGGLIYLAYDMKNVPVAKAFAELSAHFNVYAEGQWRSPKRCEEATKLLEEITLELGL